MLPAPDFLGAFLGAEREIQVAWSRVRAYRTGRYANARRPGMPPVASLAEADVPYDPDLYQQVYQHLLRHRQILVIPVDTILPTATFSVYDFAIPRYDVVPTVEEVTRCIREVEQQYPDLAVLQRAIDQWYQC